MGMSTNQDTDGGSTESESEGGGRFGRIPTPARHGTWGLVYAYAYFTLLIGGILGGAWYAVEIGLISGSVSLSVNADLGLAAELLVTGVVVIFLILSFAMLTRITGGSFMTSMLNRAASIADAYELPEKRRSRWQQETGGEEEQ